MEKSKEISKDEKIKSIQENEGELIVETQEGYKFRIVEEFVSLISNNSIWFDLDTLTWSDDGKNASIEVKSNNDPNIEYKVDNGEWKRRTCY